MYLEEYIKKEGISTDYPIFETDKEKVYRKISTTDLFLAQFSNDCFNAIDVVVKYITIENYYNSVKEGMNLYEKMQIKRVNENWNKRYIELIESFNEKGYLEESFIKTDLNYSIHDGAHRLALALYHNVPFVNVKVFNTFIERRKYDILWFINNGFNDDEIELINQKLEFLLNKCRKPYYSFIWPTATKLIDNILFDLTNELTDNVKIYKPPRNLTIKKESFEKFVSELYKIDDISIQNLNKKLTYMKESMLYDNILQRDEYKLIMLQMKINNPKFRLKPISGLPQSTETMNIKKMLRNKYKDKISKYQHDIMIHITDNEIQNELIRIFLKNFFK